MDTILIIVLAVAGTYVAISTYFFLHPEILYGFQPNVMLKDISPNNFLNKIIIAHRLGPIDGFEETTQAAEKAILNGAQVMDIDLVITKDQVPVLSHDLGLLRLCGVNKQIKDLNYADIPPFLSSYEISNSPGTFYFKKPTDASKLQRLTDFLTKLNQVDPQKKLWLSIQFKAQD